MNKVCIVGCRAITINFKERLCTIDKNVLAEGNYITFQMVILDPYTTVSGCNCKKAYKPY